MTSVLIPSGDTSRCAAVACRAAPRGLRAPPSTAGDAAVATATAPSCEGGPGALGLAITRVERLANLTRHRQAGDCPCSSSRRWAGRRYFRSRRTASSIRTAGRVGRTCRCRRGGRAFCCAACRTHASMDSAPFYAARVRRTACRAPALDRHVIVIPGPSACNRAPCSYWQGHMSSTEDCSLCSAMANYPSFCADIDAVQNGCMDSSLSHGHAAWGYHSGRTLVSVVTANPGIVGRGGSGRVAQGPSGGSTARTSNAAITTAPAIVLVRIVLIGCSRLYSDSSVVPPTESPNIACC